MVHKNMQLVALEKGLNIEVTVNFRFDPLFLSHKQNIAQSKLVSLMT